MGRKKEKHAISRPDVGLGRLKGFEHPQYVISVDGVSLNDYLNRHTNSDAFDLLVPPIGIIDAADQARMTGLLERRNVIMPLLVCSDDMDFSCIVVATYVVDLRDVVLWKHFGYGLKMSENIDVPALAFDAEEYREFTGKFRRFVLDED